MATEVIGIGTGNPALTVQRLAGAGLSVPGSMAFFATLHHSDHLTGLQHLGLTRWVMDRADTSPPLPMVVPEGPCESFVTRMLTAWAMTSRSVSSTRGA